MTKKEKTSLQIKKIDGAIKTLDGIISHWEKFAKCYFWSPPGSSSGRRSEEKRNSANCLITTEGHTIKVEIDISCSCRNYYASRDLYVDEVRKSQGLTFLRKLRKANENV